MNSKIISIGVGIGALLGALAFAGYSPFVHVIQNFGTSGAGGTNSSAKEYSVTGVAPAAPGANATSSSILNNTGNDLYIKGITVGCEGVGTSKTAYTGAGLAAFTVTMSTTSTATPASAGTAIAVMTIGTSTPTFVVASSTTASNSFLYVWNAGSYLTFTTNATNTAVCTFGAPTISS